MAIKRTRVVVPTTAALADGDRLPSTSPAVIRTLSKISRPALLSLVLEWLSDDYQPICAPYLVEREEDDEGVLYPAARSVEDLREFYQELQARKGVKKEVVDRVVEGDWRHGVTMIQLAMCDAQYLQDHPTSQRWMALKLARAESSGPELKSASLASQRDFSDLPRLHAQTFLANLQHEVGPLLRAHYHLTRPKDQPLALLRVQIHDTPYNGRFLLHEAHAAKRSEASDRSKTVYIAFPDGAPFVYVSIATAPGQPAGGEGRNLRKIVLDAIPKAISRPQARYCYQPTSLAAKTLSSLLSLRGGGRSNAAAGGWSIFADGSVERTPLDRAASFPRPRKRSLSHDDEDDDEHDRHAKHVPSSSSASSEHQRQQDKRRKLIAKGRFGNSGIVGDGKGLERFEIRIEDPLFLPSSPSHRPPPTTTTTTPLRERDPNVPRPPATSSHHPSSDPSPPPSHPTRPPQIRLTFHGTHVFAGIRRLVERGVVDGERMPAWLTGEAGVSVGVVREGRVMGAEKKVF